MEIEGIKSLVDALPLPALLLSEQRVLAVNEDARRILVPLAGDDPLDVFFGSSELGKRLFVSGVGDVTIPLLNGEHLHAAVSKHPLQIDGASLRIVILSLRDTRALRDAERDRRALDVCRIGVYEQDLVSGALFCSPLLLQIYGFNSEQSPSLQAFAEAFYPADRERVIREIMQSQDPAGDGFFDSHLRIVRPDGEVRWLHSRALTEFGEVDGQRKALFCTGSVTDVTESRTREEGWARSFAILDATPDLVSVSDLKGNPIYLNRAGRSFFNLAEGEVPSAKDMRGAYTEAALQRIEEEGIPTAIRDGSWKSETEFLNAQGEPVPMSQVIIAHLGSDGEVEHISSIARDLSREKELEHQFLHAQKMEAVGRLAGGIAHDFNNMLSVITGFASLAAKSLPEGRARFSLDEVLRAADRASELTSQLLTFSTKQIRRPRVFSLNETLEDLKPMVSRLLDESITLELRPCSPAPFIKADPNQIEQILLNLAVNARDAMPEGGRLILQTTLSGGDTTESSPDGRVWVTLSVSDTGHGMTPATCGRIFEPFFTTKGPGKGSGLGLSTVFGVVQQSGGDISVRSKVGEGTTFEIKLPCTHETPASVHPPELFERQELRPAVILLVEDDSSLRSMVATCLRQSGHSVLVASTPQDAISLAIEHAQDLDLLLTDVVMPHMNGKELSLRVTQHAPRARVLFMSGYTEAAIQHRGVHDRGVNFLAKPFAPDKLAEAVEAALRDETVETRPE